MMEEQLLERFVRDYPAQPATAIWRAAEIAALLRHPFPEGRGLDLGCGDGKLTKVILDEVGARQLVGVDPDPEETKQALALGIYERVHTAPGGAIPEAPASFDFAFSNSVLEHIPELEGVIAGVARLLKPGGLFLFTVPGPGFHAALHGPWLPWVSRTEYLAAVDKRLAHLRYPTLDAWRSLLGAHGIEVSESHPYLAPAWVRRWELVSRTTAGPLVALTGGRMRPIEIQRALKLRRAGAQWPAPVATALSFVLGLGLRESEEPGATEHDHGCLLVVGRKR